MDEKFSAILGVILVPQILDLIIKNESMDETVALNAFYQSKTYEILSNEDTKVWHFSPLTLYCVWKHERETGEIVLPEE